MKKYDKYNLATNYGNLGELIIVKNGKKKGAGDNGAVYTLLCEVLQPYGINLCGNWTGLTGWELRGCVLDKKFPEENFPILQEMYGFENADIYICLERTDSCEYGFYFNTDTLNIKLVEYRWGEIERHRCFHSFAEFWAERKVCKKKYNKILDI